MQAFLQKHSINDMQKSFSAIPNDLYHYLMTRSVRSQSGEEGFLNHVLRDLDIEGGFVCDFGASDGLFYSNTYFLIERGFAGLAIEADKKKFETLKKNYLKFAKVQCVNAFVEIEGENTLERHLDRANAPLDFDVLSIDVDHMDYYIWDSLKKYRPKVVVIEYNSYRDPICEQLPNDKSPFPSEGNDVLAATNPGQVGTGASFHSILKLGLSKGYIPLTAIGANLIFVIKELIDRITLTKIISDNSRDYLHLYKEYYYLTEKKRWVTCSLLRYNCRVRDQYLEKGRYEIDFNLIDI